MAITINGTGSITGLSAGGLPDGSVTAGDLASTLDLTGKTVTLPSGTGGKVLQVAQGLATAPLSIATGSNYNFVDITGVSATITPVSSSSSFLLIAHISCGSMSQGNTIVRFVRNGTAIGVGTGSGYNSYGFNSSYISSSNQSYSNFVLSGQFIDSPATGSAITYKVQFSGDYSGTMYFNRREADTRFSTISNITVMEISA
jgi:hypothetical protein